jgi:hypothetical protein
MPLAGVEQCHDDHSASLWLAGINVKYKIPSSGHRRGVCRIEPEKAEAIGSRYFSGRRVQATLEVKRYSNGDVVDVAEMKYVAQSIIQLTPATRGTAHSALFSHKLQASARMIAGLRAKNIIQFPTHTSLS